LLRVGEGAQHRRMSWRGESWAEIVARAATGERRVYAVTAREDARSLAARARPWIVTTASIAVTGDGLALGEGMTSLEVGFTRLYHVEPVDPWPSIAIGWVDGEDSYRTVLSPLDEDAEAFAEAVERAVSVCERRVARAAHRGWLALDVVPWERVDAIPGERAEGPTERGYRVAPGVPDPIIAERTIEVGEPRLFTWLGARVRKPPRRIEPRRIVLTRAFVYVRARTGDAVRIAAASLRAVRRNGYGDAVYTFGRSTELLLVRKEGCELAAALDARVP
jgi:hypothetical protein